MYLPNKNLLAGIINLFPLEICPWDDYYMAMAQTDYLCGRALLRSSKTFFNRTAPFGGSFTILGGLHAFLRTLEYHQFDDNVCGALKEQGYKDEFTSFLSHVNGGKLDLKVYSIPEGGIFFPNEPAIILEGPLYAVRIAEGMLLKNVNFPSLSMTKWQRVVQAGKPGGVLEFSRRRAQDDLRTSLYAHMAGAAVSSNAEIRRGFDIPIVGTMGHEWVQSWGDEFTAFDKWLEHNPHKPVLLIDTIDTLKSGVPNALKAFHKHMERIKATGAVPGIRNDSGDLAYLTLEEFRIFKGARIKVKIFETNDLDEYSVEDIKEQIFTHAPKAGLNPEEILDDTVWACGTNPGVCSDSPSLGGVAKLTSIADGVERERAVIKIAHNNQIKTSIPGSNRSAWVFDGDNNMLCCLIYRKNQKLDDVSIAYHKDDEDRNIVFDHHEGVKFVARQKLIFDNGMLDNTETLDTVRERVRNEVESLHWTYKRLKSPHVMKVSLSEELFNLRRRLIDNNQLID